MTIAGLAAFAEEYPAGAEGDRVRAPLLQRPATVTSRAQGKVRAPFLDTRADGRSQRL